MEDPLDFELKEWLDLNEIVKLSNLEKFIHLAFGDIHGEILIKR